VRFNCQSPQSTYVFLLYLTGTKNVLQTSIIWTFTLVLCSFTTIGIVVVVAVVVVFVVAVVVVAVAVAVVVVVYLNNRTIIN